MIRRYAEEQVDPAIIDRMLEHAIRAPSAGFSQGWAFLRLDTTESVGRFWASTTPASKGSASSTSSTTAGANRWLDGMRTAPVVIVPMTNKQTYIDRYAEPDKAHSDQRWPIPYWHIDTGMAALLILQTAVDEGLGACFFGIPGQQHDTFRAEFDVPADYKPIGAITIGHRLPDSGATGSSRRRQRRPVEEVVHRNHW